MDNETEKTEGHFLHILDITTQKEMGESTKQQQRRLIQADKPASLGMLTAGIAHGINNPNQAIMSNTPDLKDVWEPVMLILDSYYEEDGDLLIDEFVIRRYGEDRRLPQSYYRSDPPHRYDYSGPEGVRQI